MSILNKITKTIKVLKVKHAAKKIGKSLGAFYGNVCENMIDGLVNIVEKADKKDIEYVVNILNDKQLHSALKNLAAIAKDELIALNEKSRPACEAYTKTVEEVIDSVEKAID